MFFCADEAPSPTGRPAALLVLLASFDGGRVQFGPEHQESVHIPPPEAVHQVQVPQHVVMKRRVQAGSWDVVPLVGTESGAVTVLPVCFRRDYESRPVKLRLLDEIRAYPHRKNPDWAPEPNAPIDYCYVRPNHIPSVNAMCHDSFWPGSTHIPCFMNRILCVRPVCSTLSCCRRGPVGVSAVPGLQCGRPL